MPDQWKRGNGDRAFSTRMERDFRLMDETTSSERSNVYHTAYSTLARGSGQFW
jgi:hypothetical protein